VASLKSQLDAASSTFLLENQTAKEALAVTLSQCNDFTTILNEDTVNLADMLTCLNDRDEEREREGARLKRQWQEILQQLKKYIDDLTVGE
jgi:hypothetical protein